LSSLGVYSSDLRIPPDALAAGIGDHRNRHRALRRRQGAHAAVASGRADLRAFVTYRFTLDQIEDAYDLFANQRDGVLKIAITPWPGSCSPVWQVFCGGEA
jgi:alcohol dehydrogenase